MTYDPVLYAAFTDELVKLSAASDVLRTLAGSGMRGALTGGLAGAAAGAATADPEEGRLRGALRGATRGAMLGGATGVAARRAMDYRLLHPGASATQTAVGTARSLAGSVKRFGKRQIHGLTGAYRDNPAGMGLESHAESAKELHLAKLRHADALSRATTPEAREAAGRGYEKAVSGIHARAEAGQRALDAGVTSVPGILHGAVTKPKDTAKALWHHTTGGNRMGMALGVGLPLALHAPGLLRGDESAEGGPTMKRKLLMAGANVAGGIATAGLPIVLQMLAANAIDSSVAHRQRTPRGTVVRDVHSLDPQQGRDDVR